MELLTVEEVATMLHLKNRKSVDNWLYSGVLPRELTMKIGRKLFFVKAKLDIDIDKDIEIDKNKEIELENNNSIKKEEKEKKTNFVAKSFFQKLFTYDEDIKKYSSFKDLFIEFLEYKTAIKKQYKTEKSVRNAFLDFVRLSQNDENYARALVDNAIARGWQSIYDLSAEQKKAFKKAQNENQSAGAVDDWESRCM